ncbi:MAG TPA: hypothetical protein V6D14_01935 [Coleofasciculaceae cyanobacterium]
MSEESEKIHQLEQKICQLEQKIAYLEQLLDATISQTAHNVEEITALKQELQQLKSEQRNG